MKTQIETIRVALHQRTLDIAALGKTRELALALTTLQQGRMLLGEVLRLSGETTPYPQADNPASAEIAPPADTGETPYRPQLPLEAIPAIKEVRRRLAESVETLEVLRRSLWPRDYGSMPEAVYDRAYTEVALAKNWLGQELAEHAAGLRAAKSGPRPPKVQKKPGEAAPAEVPAPDMTPEDGPAGIEGGPDTETKSPADPTRN